MPPRWSHGEDRVLRRLYAQGVALRVIAEQVGRSPDAVDERRRVLGIAARTRSRPWSAREDALLRAATAIGLPAAVIAERLGRPSEQVRWRRRALLGAAPAPRAFTVVEDDAIRACWARGDDVERLARELGRPAGSVRLRAQKLGVHRPSARPRWQQCEDAAVRDGYQRGLTCAEIAATLDGRTAAAVAARAAKLGLATYARAWTPRDDRALRQLAGDDIELERAAQLLGRTPEALRARLRKLGLAPLRARAARRSGRRWTAGEDALLELHSGLNPAALAELLDRSPEAITQRLRRLGLRQGSQRSPHHPMVRRGLLTPGERAAIARELPGGGPRRYLALAQRMELRPADVRAIANTI